MSNSTAAGGGLDAERLLDILAETGFPTAYDHFISTPSPPFVLFVRTRSTALYADDKTFQKTNRWQIMLCTERKSAEAEQSLESALDEICIPYEVADETYVKEERLYQITYEIEELEVKT